MVRENDVQENRPPISFNTQSEPVPEEMWFQGQGIDTTSPKYQELQHFFKPLNKFSSDWMNGVLTAEATVASRKVGFIRPVKFISHILKKDIITLYICSRLP